MKRKDFFYWLTAHFVHWAILYFAFVQQSEGALRILIFMCWILAPWSLFGLHPKIHEAMAKKVRDPFTNALNRVQAWVTLFALVWFDHLPTAVAWAVLMGCTAYCHSAAKEIRDAKQVPVPDTKEPQ